MENIYLGFSTKLIKNIHYSYISTLQTLADRYTTHIRVQLISSLSCLVSCVDQFFSVAPGWAHTKMQLRRAEQSQSGRFLCNEFVFPPGNTMPMCCLCIPVYLTLIRVATLPRTIWTDPRIQRTQIDAILKEGATDSCVLRLSPVVSR